MSFKVQALTLAPSIVLLLMSIYVSILSLHVIKDLPSEIVMLMFAACFFFAGVALALCWVGLHTGTHAKYSKEKQKGKG